MSLYNQIFGKNGHSTLILAMLGLRESDIERYRDVELNVETRQIVILARTGGGNREGYPNVVLTSHPCYVCDHDDEFDSTYAHYHMRFPDDLSDDICKLADSETYGIPASVVKKFNEVMGRDETDGDKYQKEYEYQKRMIDSHMRSGNIREYNGWIYAPLNDYGLRALLKCTEDCDGVFHLGMVSFRRVVVTQGMVTTDNVVRVGVVLGKEVDHEYVEYVVNKYSGKYPKAVVMLTEGLNE